MTESMRKKTVLVIEDEPALLEAITFKLEQQGVTTLRAQTGEEALMLLQGTHPDLVWLDILLPGIDGLGVLESIRADQSLQGLPVVVVSVSASPKKIAAAKDLGALDYIVKSDNKIGSIVDRILGVLKKLELKS